MSLAIFRNACQVAEGEPLRRIGIRLRRPLRRREVRELTGSVPVQRALSGQRLGQLAEHRDTAQRVRDVIVVVAFGSALGHGDDATAIFGRGVRRVTSQA